VEGPYDSIAVWTDVTPVLPFIPFDKLNAALLPKFLFINYGVCAMALTEQDMLIRVPESEYKPLLDRERAVADVKTYLHRWIGLIHDVTIAKRS
jgi:hypothetical protein